MSETNKRRGVHRNQTEDIGSCLFGPLAKILPGGRGVWLTLLTVSLVMSQKRKTFHFGSDAGPFAIRNPPQVTIDNSLKHKYCAPVWAIAGAQDSRLDLFGSERFLTGSRRGSSHGTVLPQTIKQVGGLQTTAGGSLSSSPPSEFSSISFCMSRARRISWLLLHLKLNTHRKSASRS
jgi:hypothetical protein